jgi:hypothetical protein
MEQGRRGHEACEKGMSERQSAVCQERSEEHSTHEVQQHVIAAQRKGGPHHNIHTETEDARDRGQESSTGAQMVTRTNHIRTRERRMGSQQSGQVNHTCTATIVQAAPRRR